MSGHSNGFDTDIQLPRGGCIIRFRSVVRQELAEHFEAVGLPSCRLFLLQPVQDAVQQGQCPFAFKQSFRSQAAGRFVLVCSLSCAPVDCVQGDGATAFQCAGSVSLVGKKVFDRRQQKRSKTTLLGPHVLQVIF